MKIQPSKCTGKTQSGMRCSKKPVSGTRYCNSHSGGAKTAKEERSVERLRRRLLDQETTNNWYENHPELCTGCGRDDEGCLCYEAINKCTRCKRVDDCSCRCLKHSTWADICACNDEDTMNSKTKAPVCSLCGRDIRKIHDKIPLDVRVTTGGGVTRKYHGFCVDYGEAVREGREDEFSDNLIRSKLNALGR